MKELLKKKGIILNSKDYQENARLLTILTDNGLERVILRGANKINSKNKKFSLAPINLEFVTSNHSPLSTMTEGFIINNYLNCKIDINKQFIYLAIVEKIFSFYEGIDNKSLFYQFVTQILDLLDTTKYPEVILEIFELKLCYLIGIGPNFKCCTKCEKVSSDYSFSLNLSGVICPDCEKHTDVELNKDTTKILKYLYLIKLDKIDEYFLETIDKSGIKLNQFIDKYYQQYIDFRSKAKNIINSIN